MKIPKFSPSTIGLLQALGVTLYCVLIAGFLWLMEKSSIKPHGVLGSALILLILVFSAGLTGSLVFGYPAYLAMNKKIKKALSIFGYTFLYFLLIIIFALIVVFLIS